MTIMNKAEFVYGEVLRALETQERAVDAIQTRATVVVTAAVAAAAFFAGQTTDRDLPFLIGAAALVGAIITAGIAIRPFKLWITFDGAKLVEGYVDAPDIDQADVWRDLAIYGQAMWRDNEDSILILERALLAAIVLAGIEAAAFAVNAL